MSKTWLLGIFRCYFPLNVAAPSAITTQFIIMTSSNGKKKPAILVLCAGNSPVTGEFHAQRPVTRSFDVFFDLCPNKRLSKQSRCRVLDTIVLITTSLWCLQDYAHYAGNIAFCLCLIIMRQQPIGIDPSECGKLVAPCQRDVNPVFTFCVVRSYWTTWIQWEL